jgi:uncharacterized phage protein (TIGR02220 family)
MSLEVIKHDGRQIIYRPELNKVTGSVTATILFQQILYRFERNGGKPFYKFKEPCTHDLYVSGDSWTEELGFSRAEFDTALKSMSAKVNSRGPRPDNVLIWYWTDMERRTFYALNEAYAHKVINSLYVKRESSYRKSGNQAVDTIRYKDELTEIINKRLTPPCTQDSEGGRERPDLSAYKGVDENLKPAGADSKEAELLHKADAVIAHLNKQAGRKYKTDSLMVKRNLIPRLKTHEHLSDFLAIIDKKAKEWKGGKMDRYLSPDTLFNAEKFEKYLGEIELEKGKPAVHVNKRTDFRH